MRLAYLNIQILFANSLIIICVLMSASNVIAESAEKLPTVVIEEKSTDIKAEGNIERDGVRHERSIVTEAENPVTDEIGSREDDSRSAKSGESEAGESEASEIGTSEIEAEEMRAGVEEGEEAEQSYKIYRQEHDDNPCDRGLDTYDYEEQWYDSSQIYVNTKFCEPALWFDNYFSNDRIFEEGVAGTYIRLRNDFTYDEEEYFEFKIKLKASVELPGTENRLRLTFEGDEDEDLRDIAPGNGEDTSNSLGLQFDIAKNARSKFSVTASFSPKIRFRYRYTYPITNEITMRLTQDLQRKEKINSSRTRIDYEHLLWKSFLFRSSSEVEVTEEFDGANWVQTFVMYQRISSKTSIAYESSVNGITEPDPLVLNYRVGVRYRKNFHREWLFYEIAPEYTWPITLSEDRLLVEQERRSKWLIFLRLEIHFGNASKRRYQDFN